MLLPCAIWLKLWISQRDGTPDTQPTAKRFILIYDDYLTLVLQRIQLLYNALNTSTRIGRSRYTAFTTILRGDRMQETIWYATRKTRGSQCSMCQCKHPLRRRTSSCCRLEARHSLPHECLLPMARIPARRKKSVHGHCIGIGCYLP